MALAGPAKAVDISSALTQLEPLGADEYFIAFGPAGRQFCGTPNGYSARQLPPRVVTDVLNGGVKKVKWASFGDGHPSSYFFAYEMKDGSPGHRAGKAIPSTLRPFLNHVFQQSLELASSLRVQLGANRSWVAWAGTVWGCRKVPIELEAALCQISVQYHADNNGIRGVLKSGTLTNVTWNNSGGYYMKSSEHIWSFESAVIQRGWNVLWDGLQHIVQNEDLDLAYVGMDPHSTTGDTFAFVMKKQAGREPDFVVRFEPEDMVSRLPLCKGEFSKPTDNLELVDTDEPTEPAATGLHANAGPHRQVVNVAKPPDGTPAYRWAVSRRSGRSHASDTWELDLEKGKRVKVLEEKGNDWFIVQDGRGRKGYAHGSWLEFKEIHPHIDPREAYELWKADTDKWLQIGAIRTFPSPSRYMDACAKDICKPLKKEGNICAHDLHELLRGSGKYSLEFLKAQRTRYHPDKFARYCHPEKKEELKSKAEALFVLFGVLMDWLENRPQKGQVG
ncbi:hypothetical protein K458DRAFT_369169 [Lentithecium fluviatile CBS 122367]|uniref:SH3 domain-containing protein n=1 Tax=Lentithecium fluviatile CBS 122367 TaxID=1168545 RepID=A0A6G1IYK3_9PLEO|nr:hypothetical protein K458DRAFT_369169 [Lentithecium fluviatile CBS 122367]